MIEDLLRSAKLRVPAYTREQQADDDRRLRERIQEVAQRRALLGQARQWLAPASPELAALVLASSDESSKAGSSIKSRLREDLTTLCRAVIKAQGAGDRLVAFMSAERPDDPVAARSFGCLLFIAGHSDDARFWWRYAAGADDATAAYCLFLEGLLRDVVYEAVFCYRKYGASAFLCDEDFHVCTSRPAAADAVLHTEVEEHVQEVATRETGHLRIPGGYLDDVPEKYRKELLAHR